MRESLVITAFLALGASGCDSEPQLGCERSRNAPNLTVRFRHVDGTPVQDSAIAVSIGDRVIDFALPDASGAAEVYSEPGALVSGYLVTRDWEEGEDGYPSVYPGQIHSRVAPASGGTLDIDVGNSYPTPFPFPSPSGTPIGIVASGLPEPNGGSVSLQDCSHNASPQAYPNATFQPWCLQEDGTVSVYGTGYAEGHPQYQGWALDVALGTTGVQLVLSSSLEAFTAPVVAGFAVSGSVRFLRKGRPIGAPDSVFLPVSGVVTGSGWSNADTHAYDLTLTSGNRSYRIDERRAGELAIDASSLPDLEIVAAGGSAKDAAFSWSGATSGGASWIASTFTWWHVVGTWGIRYVSHAILPATSEGTTAVPPIPNCLRSFEPAEHHFEDLPQMAGFFTATSASHLDPDDPSPPFELGPELSPRVIAPAAGDYRIVSQRSSLYLGGN